MRFFGTILLIAGMITLAGCASTRLPLYLQDRGAQAKRFYADYDQTLTALKETLNEQGWQIEKQVAPSVYEQNRYNDLNGQQTLILTALRESRGWTGRRYGRMNIYLRSKSGISELEVRALSVHAWVRLRRYGRRVGVSALFKGVERRLQPGEDMER